MSSTTGALTRAGLRRCRRDASCCSSAWAQTPSSSPPCARGSGRRGPRSRRLPVRHQMLGRRQSQQRKQALSAPQQTKQALSAPQQRKQRALETSSSRDPVEGLESMAQTHAHSMQAAKKHAGRRQCCCSITHMAPCGACWCCLQRTFGMGEGTRPRRTQWARAAVQQLGCWPCRAQTTSFTGCARAAK